jgi:hypothetical protein
MEKSIFDVGLTFSIEAYFRTHQTTQLLGWDTGLFLLTKAIYIQGQPSKLTSKDLCKVRCLKDGVAYGFESEVIFVQFYPFPLMFLKYPTHIERLDIRVSRRFKFDLPATFSDASGVVISSEAVILDISEGGCGLKVPVQEGVELLPDAAYNITFRIMDKDLNIGLTMRKMDRKGEGTCILGMEFTGIGSQDKETLTLILDFLSKHSAG